MREVSTDFDYVREDRTDYKERLNCEVLVFDSLMMGLGTLLFK